MPKPSLIQAVCAALPLLSGHSWFPLSGGQTNRLWRVADAVVKSYPAGRDSPLFPNDPKAEAQALLHFAPVGLAPRLLAAGQDWVVYTYVKGSAWSQGVEQVAALLARLHALCADHLPFRAIPSGHSALLDQTHLLCRLAGLDLAIGAGDDVAPCKPRPIHGDAVAGNVIVTDAQPLLIDWQCPALGDPTEDLAAFLSPAMQTVYRGHPLTPQEEADFLSAYPEPEIVARYRALAPIYHARMAAHCVWRANRGDAGYAEAARAELARL